MKNSSQLPEKLDGVFGVGRRPKTVVDEASQVLLQLQNSLIELQVVLVKFLAINETSTSIQ